MTVSLYQGVTAGWSSAATSAPYQIGNPWRQTEDSYVTDLGFWRGDTGSGVKPTALSLFARADGSLLAFVATPTDTGAIGWQWSTLATPVPVTNGAEYLVCAYYPAGNVWYRVFSASKPTPPANTTWLSFPRQDEANIANNAYPASPETADVYNAVDVKLGDPSSSAGGPGATVGDLASWLSNDPLVQQHSTDGLPYQTKVDTADTRTKVTNGLNLAGGLQGLSDSLAHTLQMASDYVAGRTSTYFADLKDRLIGASGGGGSAFYGAGGTQVSEGVEALLARSTNAQVGFPASPWEMTAETDFDDALAWAEPADLYVVTFATIPPDKPNNGRAGVPVYFRLAWWTPLNGTFAQERRWVDFNNSHLVDPAGRMPGLLLQTYDGGTGHVQAWTLNV